MSNPKHIPSPFFDNCLLVLLVLLVLLSGTAVGGTVAYQLGWAIGRALA